MCSACPLQNGRRNRNPGPAEPAKEGLATDALGDPLPADALFRLGTLRFRVDGVVRALAFTQDGKKLCCAGWDKAIRRWNAQTGAEFEPLHGPEKGFVDAAVSAAGNTLIGGTADGNVYVWDLTAGKELKKIAVEGTASKVVRKVAISADGRTSGRRRRGTTMPSAYCGLDGRHPTSCVLTTYKHWQAVLRRVFPRRQAWWRSPPTTSAAQVHEGERPARQVFQPRAKKGARRFPMLCTRRQNASRGRRRRPLPFRDVPTGQPAAADRRRRRAALGGSRLPQPTARRLPAAHPGWDDPYLGICLCARNSKRSKGHADNVQTLAFFALRWRCALASGGSGDCAMVLLVG